VVQLLAHDAEGVARFLALLHERDRTAEDAGDSEPGVRLLVVTGDADTATELALAAHGSAGAPSSDRALLVPVTGARRATPMLKRAPPSAIVASAEVLLELVRASTLKLDRLSTLGLAWIDEIESMSDPRTVEALLAEIPKGAARVATATTLTPEVESFLERYARRAARIGIQAGEAGVATALRYLVVPPPARSNALRRVLDVLNPEDAAIYVRSPRGREEVGAIVRALGYSSVGGLRMIGDDDTVTSGLVILWDLPSSPTAVHELATRSSASPIALVSPRQLAALRALAAGGSVEPVLMPELGAAIRGSAERLRRELREILARGAPTGELLVLEPLLSEFDGVELAAAALGLLRRDRESHTGEPAASAAVPESRAAPRQSQPVRIFVNAGSRDSITARDLVGAIANETGVAGAHIGRIEVRDTHSVVEVAPEAADAVLGKLPGVTLRGRRLSAKRDEGRGRTAAAEPERKRSHRRPRAD
jgi:ATP-dependent RNA helicase DeaD